jgi:hypothetical protein
VDWRRKAIQIRTLRAMLATSRLGWKYLKDVGTLATGSLSNSLFCPQFELIVGA